MADENSVSSGERTGDGNEADAAKGRLSLRPGGRMEMGKTVDAGSVRQSFSHGRSKTVQVEVVKKRGPAPAVAAGAARPASGPGGPGTRKSSVGRPARRAPCRDRDGGRPRAVGGGR